jgi:hypothetical protein
LYYWNKVVNLIKYHKVGIQENLYFTLLLFLLDRCGTQYSYLPVVLKKTTSLDVPNLFLVLLLHCMFLLKKFMLSDFHLNIIIFCKTNSKQNQKVNKKQIIIYLLTSHNGAKITPLHSVDRHTFKDNCMVSLNFSALYINFFPSALFT